MSADLSHEVTRLLREWQGGDRAALERLTPLVYDELRRLAAHYLRGERKDHTLQGTALVNEAFIRLVGQSNLELQNRSHFFGIAARLMRQILVDHARKHAAVKRGGGAQDLSIEEAAVFTPEHAATLVALDEALAALAEFDPRKSRIVELRLFWFAVAEALIKAVVIWLFYIALEPYVRRRSPHRIISWSRLMAGNWRDPLVGRDILLGLIIGLGGTALSTFGGELIGRRLGWPGDVLTDGTLSRRSSRRAASHRSF